MLEKRQSLRSTWDEKKLKAYRVQVLDDRARVRRRFGLPGRAGRGEEVTNETALPPPKRSKLGQQLHVWCQQHSWGMCRQCHSMVPLPLTELSLQRPLPKATVPAGSCVRCHAKVACAAPLPEEVPEPLRNLSEESCQSLAPLELDVGPEIRAAHNSGYRQHATIIRFAWKAQSVKKEIKHIANKEERAKAKAAFTFLLEKEDCSYRKLVEDHDKFLAKHPGADDRKRRRRLQFIETPGLETALWPHLFYLDSLCLTTVRSTDIRRRGSAYGPSLEAFLDAEVPDGDSEEEDIEDGQRHSTKRAYAALALSARIGYGSSYELMHFAYDLNLWSALGAKKKTSVDYDIPMRVLMKGHSFSPLYWKAVHWALLDMVRQMGYAKVFWTISPYEWSMPYHVWLLDEMAKELRGRLHLAVAESLHVTHVLLQVVRGLLAGATGSKTKDRWERHLLRAVGEDGQAGMGETRSNRYIIFIYIYIYIFIYIVHSLAKRAFSSECLRRKSSTSGQTDTKPNKLSDCFFPIPTAGLLPEVHAVKLFLRVEFQDGTRKAPTQDYHGSGRPHVHVLVFGSQAAMRCMAFPETVMASMPEAMDAEDALPGIVRGSQLDRSHRSGWPVHESKSQWAETDKGLQLQLHHTAENKRQGLRPYFVDVMDALRCHQDFQFTDDDGALRAYVAKYVSKFSDSNQASK